MPLLHGSHGNLIGGVSQQAAPIRKTSQCEESINFLPSPVEGLMKRPHSDHVAKIMSGTLAEAYTHVIDRGDGAERYMVIITDDDLKVYDLITGVQQNVAFPNGKSYLDNVSPRSGFRAVTVQDFTYIVNRNMVPTMITGTVYPDLTKDPGKQALVWVRTGVAATTYKIHLKVMEGSTEYPESEKTANHTTDGASSTQLATPDIAKQLIDDSDYESGPTPPAAPGYGIAQVVSNYANWDVIKKGSVIRIRRDDKSEDFEIRVEDDWGDAGMSLAKGFVQHFQDLPDKAPKGFKIKVAGSPESTYDDYWVEFETLNDIGIIDAGTWVETTEPGIEWRIDRSTMPHELVRVGETLGVSNFEFRWVEYSHRLVGSEESNPNPSFIGKKINDVFFFKNRLGFLTQQHVVLSGAGEYKNFFRTTVLTLLPSDRIDTATGDTKVADMYFGVPFQEQLVLFSDQAQYILSGGSTLTPQTVSVNRSTSFVSSRTVPPIAVGRDVYFSELGGSFSSVREYFVDKDNKTKDAADITAHVPLYIEGSIQIIAGTSNADILAILADNTNHPGRLYMYKYLWAGDDKLQSAWGKWDFEGTILNAAFLDTVMFLLIQYDDGVYIDRVVIEPGSNDPDSRFRTHLDRRVDSDTLAMVYDGAADETTVTLPYDTSTVRAVTRSVDWATWTSNGGTLRAEEDREYDGVEITVLSVTGPTVVIEGDVRGVPLWLGIPFTAEYTFSTWYARAQDRTGTEVAETDGRTQIRSWSVDYNDAGPFSIEVTPDLRPTSTYEFAGYVLDTEEALLDNIALQSGTARVPVLSENKRVTVKIVSDSHMPCRFVSGTVEYFIHTRSQRY